MVVKKQPFLAFLQRDVVGKICVMVSGQNNFAASNLKK